MKLRNYTTLLLFIVLAYGGCGHNSSQDESLSNRDLVPVTPDSLVGVGRKSIPSSNKNGLAGSEEIASAEEALCIAKSNSNVQSFLRTCSERGYETKSYADFKEQQGLWIVVFYAVDVMDLFVEVHLTTSGISVHGEGG